MQRGQIDSSKEAGKYQSRNTFLLRRISIESNCPSIQVDFSPDNIQTSSLHLPNTLPHLRQAVPTFNHDSRYFTPAFIIQADKEKYVNNALSYLALHEVKIVQFSTEKTELFVPRPSKLSNFCCVCKAIFEDYLTHVNIPIHQQLLRGSVFNESISQLCKIYKKEQVEVVKKGKKTTRKIVKVGKTQKDKRKKSDSLLNSIVVKLESNEQAKTTGLVD